MDNVVFLAYLRVAKGIQRYPYVVWFNFDHILIPDENSDHHIRKFATFLRSRYS